VNDLAQQAQRASSGQPDAAIGRIYLSQRMYDQAIAALRKGIQKGALEHSDQGRIDLGVAYLKSGETQQATRHLRRSEGGLRMAWSRGAVVTALKRSFTRHEAAQRASAALRRIDAAGVLHVRDCAPASVDRARQRKK
jgi:hypothetical protein